MSFLNPAAFWAFSLVIPLIAIYFLKVKPEKKYTATLFLWEKVFQEKQTSALFKRLRDLFSLLLMLLVFSFIILAMAQPVLVSKDSLTNLVIVLDTSPSMQAIEKNGKTRLNIAKNLAQNIIKNLSANQKATLAAANDALRIISNSTSNKKLLMEGIEKINSSCIPLNVENLNTLATNKKLLENTRFLFLSDGCSKNIKALTPTFELIKVGSPVENVGIIAFDLRKLPGALANLGLYFQLTSSYKKTIEVDVILCQGTKDNIIKVCPVKVTPGVNPPEIFTLNEIQSGKWLLYIDHKDALEIDNTSYAFLPEQKPVKISISNPNNSLFYQNCIDAFKHSSDQLLFDAENPEVIICDGNFKPQDNCSAYIILNPKGQSVFWNQLGREISGTIANPILAEHNSIKFAPIESIAFEGAKELKAPGSATVVADNGQNVPLIYKSEVDGKKAYVINLDPTESDLFLSINFPILIYSMALDLVNRTQIDKVTYQTGDLVEFPQKTTLNTIQVTTPNNIKKQLTEGEKIILTTPGFYCLSEGSAKTYIGCSLLSSADSFLENSSIMSSAKPLEKGVPVGSILVILALLLGSIECILYHRRKVG